MCNECSHFLSIDESSEFQIFITKKYAQFSPFLVSIINPNHEYMQPDSNSEVIMKEPEDSIRLCEHCLHLLETRKEMQDSRLSKPVIIHLYDRIETLKKEVMPDIYMYEKMIDSLYQGGSVFTLADAGSLRGKIGTTAEALDDLSKKVVTLKSGKGSQQEALQKSIRLSVIKFIKENMLTLPQIPVEEEIKKIQQKRVMELNQKIERDRRLAQEAFEKYELSGNSGYPAAAAATSSSKPVTVVKSVDNWSGYQHLMQSNPANDPLIEQINIIQSYIKQAREERRFEEIETLEANLQELRHEFWIRNQDKAEN
jgi:rabenosyn-5